MTDDRTDNPVLDPEVLVVGGGPAGLAAAVALGRLGVRTLMVERRATTSTHPRGHVENGRTMELFRLWGIDAQVREQGLPRTFLGAVTFRSRMAGIDLGTFHFGDDTEWLMSPDGQGPCSMSSTPQDRLEPILLARADACESVTTMFGWSVTDLTQDDDGVTAELTGPGGERKSVEARYAVAADGPHSPTRERLGIETQGPGYLGSQLGIYFHADLTDMVAGYPATLYWLYNPEAQGVVIALDGGTRWHLLFAYDAEKESAEDYPPERCEAIVRSLVGRDDVEIDIRSVLPWRMRGAVAERFRSGRIFLAGDAAHTMPVTGGMGMNTGIGDVHNLAWKLAAVLRGAAGPGLLDSYEAERMPVGRANTEHSVENARKMVEAGLAGIMVSDPEGFAAIEEPEGADLRARIAAAIPGQSEHFCFDGLTFGYVYDDSSAIVDDGTPVVTSGISDYVPSAHPGARAPHVWLDDDGREVSPIDLSDGRFVVLAADPAWADAARDVARGLDVPLDAYVVGAGGRADLGDDPRTEPGAWAERYGVGAQGAVLVRPDGHVGWRSPGAAQDPARELDAALRSILALA